MVTSVTERGELMSTNDIHATVDQQLRRTRQRYTHGRRQLVDLLVASDRPLTIPELIEHGAGQSQSSLYRNLAILEQCGAVHRLLSTDDVSRYELTEALSDHHHHHLVCRSCGRIDDVTLTSNLEAAIAEAIAVVRDEQDFAVDSHRLDLLGTCARCR